MTHIVVHAISSAVIFQVWKLLNNQLGNSSIVRTGPPILQAQKEASSLPDDLRSVPHGRALLSSSCYFLRVDRHGKGFRKAHHLLIFLFKALSMWKPYLCEQISLDRGCTNRNIPHGNKILIACFRKLWL